MFTRRKYSHTYTRTPRFFIESSNGDVEAAIAAYYESGGAESTAGNEAQEGDLFGDAATLASRWTQMC